MSCQSCNTCQSNTCTCNSGCQAGCDSCQSCNSGCQGCDACQMCNTGCQSSCNTSQAFCVTTGQNVGLSVAWSTCPDETINISASSYNTLLSNIRSAYERGGGPNGFNRSGDYNGETVNPEEAISASKINNLADNIWGLGGSSPSQPTAYKNAVITSDIFSKIVQGVSNMKYDARQCYLCNTSCNDGCDSCQKCDNGCQIDCNSCQKCNDGCQIDCNAGCQSCNSGCQGNSPSQCCDDTPSS